MSILSELQVTIDQSEACHGDGSAQREWQEARNIDKLELNAMSALVATGQLPLEQYFRVAYECGFKDALRVPVDQIAPD